MTTQLLADHQATGAYSKIATIISGRIDGCVQLRSHQTLVFVPVKAEAAIRSLRSMQRVQQLFLDILQSK